MKNVEDITIVIEDVVGCPGHCAGCVLSEFQRTDKTPKFSLSLLDKSLEKIKEHLDNLNQLKRIQLVFGIADHFILPLDYLEKIFLKSSSLMKKLNIDKESGIFITTSMIGKTNVIVEKVNFLQKLSEQQNTRLFFNVVLDTNTFQNQKLLSVFSENVQKSFEISKSLDLTINLSYETLSHVTPKVLIDYCLSYNFKHLVVNWLPTINNFDKVYKNVEEISKWLLDLLEYSKNQDFHITFKKTIKDTLKFSKNYQNTDSLIDVIESQFIYNSVNNLIINSDGKIFINYEAIGDIPHGENLNVEPLGSVYDEITIMEMIGKKSKYYTSLAMKNIMNENCLNCEFIKECAISGFHYYNKIISDNMKKNKQVKIELDKTLNSLGCYHMSKSLFKSLK